ncbi:glycoside hydrolase family 44 protein [Cohnella sp. GbtcB17]|uniref:glycoside hydrolase family 44 protein n=1 Tax=Cohnella sp. GbtcB17 TaxID=2824762 RepID=UPI0020C65C00|nr:glycoside hydrolase family 44 protein [Cohnella sp. GbtcB17]
METTYRKKLPWRKPLTAVLAFAVLLGQLAVGPAKSYGDTERLLTVYDDSLSAEFSNYGWAQANLAATGTVHSGTRAIELNADEGQALYFYKDRIMNADEYGRFSFWANGGAAGGQAFKLIFSLGGQAVAEIPSTTLLPDGVPGGAWKKVSLKLADYGVRGIIDGIWIWGAGEQEPFYLDDMRFEGEGAGTGEEPGGGPGEEDPGQAAVTGIVFSQNMLTLREGGLRPAGLNAVRADGSSAPVTSGVAWSTDDASIATVANGLVSGLRPGTTTLRASYEGFEAQIDVTVVEGTPAGPIEEIDGDYVYADALSGAFADYSGIAHDLAETDTVRTGQSSIRLEPDGDKGLYLYSGVPVNARTYDRLRLWVNGGDSGGQQFSLKLTQGGTPVAELDLDALVPGGIAAGTWSEVTVNLTDLHLPGAIFDGILLQGATDGVQPAAYLDDIALLKKFVASAQIAELRIDKPRTVMLPGESNALAAEAFYAGGDTKTLTEGVTWTVDRPDVLQLDGGAIKGLTPGIAKVTATYKTFSTEAYVQVTEVAAEPVYGDTLADGFRNYSWHDKDLANTEQVHGGAKSIKFNPSGWDGVWLSHDGKFDIEQYYGLRFWIYGGATGGQQLLIHAYDGDAGIGAVDLNDYLPEGGLPAGQWTEVTVSMADLGLSAGSFDGLIFQAATDRDQAVVYIDDVSLLRNLHAGELPEPQLPQLSVDVDPSADRKPINPEIYGINYDDMHPTQSTLQFPVQRWGGNNTTRYNWQLNVANRANDWYFINYPYENDPREKPGSSVTDQLISGVNAQGGKVLLTVPTIGWTPKDREIRYGFSVQKYGDQQSVAQDVKDAGNGVREDGSFVAGNDPTDTSKPIGPTFVNDWMQHLKDTGNNVNYYALDNEPEIWNSTHRDVHPAAPTYDEIWNFTEKYGAAIKAKDPSAKVFGPTSWGWCAYFYSSADVCAEGPDRAAHGNTPFLEWYLQQVADYAAEHNGQRLVDYLDIHYYSQSAGVPDADEGPGTVKRRFQGLKALYDPDYVDDSWIQEPIRLIPRMKEIIDSRLPGTKLALTEYNFGNGNGISSGIAQAEALAIFGREGLDLATRFGTLPAGSPLEDAFKLYLDYDGNGSQIRGDSVRAVSSLPDAVGSYAIDGSDGKLYVLLFNKDTVTREVNVGLGEGSGSGSAELYRFDAATRLSAAGAKTVGEDGKLTLRLAARSATLAVVAR